jgi:hypothetical protein
MALLTAAAKGFSRRALPVALTGLRSATSSRLPDLQPLTQAHRQAYVPYVSAFFAGNNRCMHIHSLLSNCAFNLSDVHCYTQAAKDVRASTVVWKGPLKKAIGTLRSTT